MAEEFEEEESTEARFRRVQDELRALELPEISDEEVNARLNAIKGQGRASLPDVPLGDSRLRELEARTTKARGTHHQAKGGEPSARASDQKAAKGLGVGLAIAYAFLGLSMAGLGIGYLIDQATGSSAWKGLGTVVGAIGGIVFAIVLSNRESSRL